MVSMEKVKVGKAGLVLLVQVSFGNVHYLGLVRNKSNSPLYTPAMKELMFSMVEFFDLKRGNLFAKSPMYTTRGTNEMKRAKCIMHYMSGADSISSVMLAPRAKLDL